MKNKCPELPMFAVILYTITIVTSLVLTNKIIDVHGFLISSCLIVFPIIFFMGDIIAEIYGYNVAKQLILYALIGAGFFSLIITLTINIPTPKFYDNYVAYEKVFGMSLKFIAVGFLAIWVGAVVNAYVIARWKKLVNGRYFWLRSIGSSAVGELINSVIAFPLGFGGVLPMEKVFNLLFVSYIIKLVYAVVAAPIGALIAHYIKTKKGLNFTEDHVSFNPFIDTKRS
jgi:queuosine precursor transporter